MDSGMREQLAQRSNEAMKLRNRRRIAWISLWAIFAILGFAIFVPVVFGGEFVAHIQNLLPLFQTIVLALTGNVAFYMGSSAYMVNSLNRDLFASNENQRPPSSNVRMERTQFAARPEDSDYGSELPRG